MHWQKESHRKDQLCTDRSKVTGKTIYVLTEGRSQERPSMHWQKKCHGKDHLWTDRRRVTEKTIYALTKGKSRKRPVMHWQKKCHGKEHLCTDRRKVTEKTIYALTKGKSRKRASMHWQKEGHRKDHLCTDRRRRTPTRDKVPSSTTPKCHNRPTGHVKQQFAERCYNPTSQPQIKTRPVSQRKPPPPPHFIAARPGCKRAPLFTFCTLTAPLLLDIYIDILTITYLSYSLTQTMVSWPSPARREATPTRIIQSTRKQVLR